MEPDSHVIGWLGERGRLSVEEGVSEGFDAPNVDVRVDFADENALLSEKALADGAEQRNMTVTAAKVLKLRGKPGVECRITRRHTASIKLGQAPKRIIHSHRAENISRFIVNSWVITLQKLDIAFRGALSFVFLADIEAERREP